MTAEHSQIQWQLRSDACTKRALTNPDSRTLVKLSTCQEKQQHRETKQDLHDEALLHLQTKAKLEEATD